MNGTEGRQVPPMASSTEAGSTPQAQLQQLQFERAEGKVNDADYWRRREPLDVALSSGSSGDSPRISAAQARAELEALRADRIAGRVTESQFLERNDYLGRLAAGEEPSATDVALTQEQKLDAEYETMMKGAQPQDYRLDLPPGASEATAEEREFDGVVRNAFAGANIPKHLGDAIYSGIGETLTKLAATPDVDLRSRVDETRAALSRQWGEDFDARVAAIDLLLDEMVEKQPELGTDLDTIAVAIACNPLVLDCLGRIVQHQARGR